MALEVRADDATPISASSKARAARAARVSTTVGCRTRHTRTPSWRIFGAAAHGPQPPTRAGCLLVLAGGTPPMQQHEHEHQQPSTPAHVCSDGEHSGAGASSGSRPLPPRALRWVSGVVAGGPAACTHAALACPAPVPRLACVSRSVTRCPSACRQPACPLQMLEADAGGRQQRESSSWQQQHQAAGSCGTRLAQLRCWPNSGALGASSSEHSRLVVEAAGPGASRTRAEPAFAVSSRARDVA